MIKVRSDKKRLMREQERILKSLLDRQNPPSGQPSPKRNTQENMDQCQGVHDHEECWGSHVLADLEIPKDETTSNHFGALGSSPPGPGEGSLQ